MRAGQYMRAKLLAIVIAGMPLAASAGMFDDEVARTQNAATQKELSDFRTETKASLDRLEAAMKMQLELASQIEALRGEIAKVRGQVEVVTYEGENIQKRQRDFYLDLDVRLRKIEAASAEAQAKLAEAATPPKPMVDPAAETRAYESALNLFKANKYKEAQTAFQAFLRDFPTGTFVASGQFWLANSFYALHDCKGAIDAHAVMVASYPTSVKTPDSMLAIAVCQQELKDNKASRKTLEQLVATYPQSPAAESAKQRLKRK